MNTTCSTKSRITKSDILLASDNGKLGQNPHDVRNKPGITLINSDISVFQDPDPPISKDYDVKQPVDTWLIYVFPVPFNMAGDLSRMEFVPIWLDCNPPLYYTSLEGAETIIWGKFSGVSTRGPPFDCLGPVICGDGATDI